MKQSWQKLCWFHSTKILDNLKDSFLTRKNRCINKFWYQVTVQFSFLIETMKLRPEVQYWHWMQRNATIALGTNRSATRSLIWYLVVTQTKSKIHFMYNLYSTKYRGLDEINSLTLIFRWNYEIKALSICIAPTKNNALDSFFSIGHFKCFEKGE